METHTHTEYNEWYARSSFARIQSHLVYRLSMHLPCRRLVIIACISFLCSRRVRKRSAVEHDEVHCLLVL